MENEKQLFYSVLFNRPYKLNVNTADNGLVMVKPEYRTAQIKATTAENLLCPMEYRSSITYYEVC